MKIMFGLLSIHCVKSELDYLMCSKHFLQKFRGCWGLKSEIQIFESNLMMAVWLMWSPFKAISMLFELFIIVMERLWSIRVLELKALIEPLIQNMQLCQESCEDFAYTMYLISWYVPACTTGCDDINMFLWSWNRLTNAFQSWMKVIR